MPYVGRYRIRNEADSMSESWLKVITKVGVPSAIAIYLVVQLGGEIKSAVADTRALMQRHVEATAPMLETQRAILNVAVQQCVNAAATEPKRDLCFAAQWSGPAKPDKH